MACGLPLRKKCQRHALRPRGVMISACNYTSSKLEKRVSTNSTDKGDVPSLSAVATKKGRKRLKGWIMMMMITRAR